MATVVSPAASTLEPLQGLSAWRQLPPSLFSTLLSFRASLSPRRKEKPRTPVSILWFPVVIALYWLHILSLEIWSLSQPRPALTKLRVPARPCHRLHPAKQLAVCTLGFLLAVVRPNSKLAGPMPYWRGGCHHLVSPV